MKKSNPPDWIIVYDDETTFDSNDGSFADAPAWGMQAAIFKSKETGWSICTGGDYFAQLGDGTFLALDHTGLVDYSANVWKTIKVGRYLSRPEFAGVIKLANDMMRDIVKTAHFKGERQE